MLRDYLLGWTAEDAAARLEERLLEQHGLFEALGAAEDDLFDDCARGLLTRDERERFLSQYGHDHARLDFADALRRRVGRLPQPE